jgi:hypothetical protein
MRIKTASASRVVPGARLAEAPFLAPFVDILVREAVRSLTESRLQGSVPTNAVQVSTIEVGSQSERATER